ncbi:hypothetical protein BRADI_2g04317v3 [Brachypodium distachyon]|uniref:G-patch domain-containing protein n=1 Tax=Brachypodium distachyon TaxID=15368 RepID=A0A0Q3IAN4_BRADI|nr:hypothetical protein BRADI_2g04317v3 [Brachypodium distachyon]
MEGSGGEPGTESSAGFEWDADSQLYYHASTGFYHDPVAGWYYSSTDGQYYIYENGDYKLWTSDVGKEPKVHYPCDEASQAGPELDSPQQPPPSEWMEETLINMYLSGYSNIEVNTENLLGDSQTNEEEKWLSQYGQVERVNDDIPLLPSVDLWDWHMVTEPVSKGQPMARLVGRLTRGSSKLHPSLPARGGLLRTAPVIEVHLDLVRVSSGKLYRLRNPSRKHLASLSAYDSSNPTKDWGFPDIYATNNNSRKLSTAHCQPEVIDESSIGTSVSAASGKEYKINTYRDRAAERRILHRGLGIGPGQKQSNVISSDEYGETIETMDSMGAAPVDMNFRSSGLKSAKRIMENMGWKEGEALGKSRQGIVEPIHPAINKHGAGLGWNQTR